LLLEADLLERLRRRVVGRARELGVALHEGEAQAELVGHGPQQRGLAGAGRALDEDVTSGVQGRQHQLQFAAATDEPTAEAVEHRLRVEFSHRS